MAKAWLAFERGRARAWHASGMPGMQPQAGVPFHVLRAPCEHLAAAAVLPRLGCRYARGCYVALDICKALNFLHSKVG